MGSVGPYMMEASAPSRSISVKRNPAVVGRRPRSRSPAGSRSVHRSLGSQRRSIWSSAEINRYSILFAINTLDISACLDLFEDRVVDKFSGVGVFCFGDIFGENIQSIFDRPEG